MCYFLFCFGSHAFPKLILRVCWERASDVNLTDRNCRYMVGREPAAAKPTLIFTCKRQKSRRRAMKFVKESEILRGHPKIALSESSSLPEALGEGYATLLASMLDPRPTSASRTWIPKRVTTFTTSASSISAVPTSSAAGLSYGAKVGIAVGTSIVGLAVLAALLWIFFVQRRKSYKQPMFTSEAVASSFTAPQRRIQHGGASTPYPISAMPKQNMQDSLPLSQPVYVDGPGVPTTLYQPKPSEIAVPNPVTRKPTVNAWMPQPVFAIGETHTGSPYDISEPVPSLSHSSENPSMPQPSSAFQANKSSSGIVSEIKDDTYKASQPSRRRKPSLSNVGASGLKVPQPPTRSILFHPSIFIDSTPKHHSFYITGSDMNVASLLPENPKFNAGAGKLDKPAKEVGISTHNAGDSSPADPLNITESHAVGKDKSQNLSPGHVLAHISSIKEAEVSHDTPDFMKSLEVAPDIMRDDSGPGAFHELQCTSLYGMHVTGWESQRLATIGGIVVCNGVPYGLTARHALESPIKAIPDCLRNGT